MIIPDTDIMLLKVPLELGSNNQLTFATLEAQYNYFSSLPQLEDNNATYMRKDGVLRFNGNYDECLEYNYCMYRNKAYGNKWFYAFIEDMQYINDQTVHCKLRTDPWQTWQFDLTFKPVFVEREHPSTDNAGDNTVPENLELGEPIINSVVRFDPSSATPTGYYITFLVSDIRPLSFTGQPPSSYAGIFSGFQMFGVETNANALAIIDEYIRQQETADAIKGIFLVPKSLYGNATQGGSSSFPFLFYFPQASDVISIFDNMNVGSTSTLDGYQPRCKKLLTYPYSYLYATNNAGLDVEYHYEDFTNNSASFRMAGVPSQGCDIKVYPLNFKRQTQGNEVYGFSVAKLPICSWTTSSYDIWLAQNALNMNVGVAFDTANALVAVASNQNSNSLGVGLSLAQSISEKLVAKYHAERMPNQSHGNINSSEFNFAQGKFVEFRKMSVRAEYARIIDDYFNAYGYATHRVKVPNITGRKYWNFVKTQGCYIEGHLPNNDLTELRNMFDNGITFWHDPTKFMDYTQNNEIVV